MSETFSQRFKACRANSIDPETNKPYTQAKIASLCGVDLSTVRNWLRGPTLPFGNNRKALLVVFPLLFSKC